ncbi:MAG: peptide chain release factor N(5)-glutamine methyltransferase [Pirellulaceae bacterium]|jgi:release factor glutamine methyltransferase|nr:peptide chain release factor N(5)-glutamine methyltransferase [Pirellulaceae bacterium]
MSTAEAWTVGKLLTWTTEYLKSNGSQSPRLDAEVLLAHARGCQRIELYTAFAEEPTEETKAAFREMVRRRSEGTPVAYLVGYKEFYSATFEVNPDVLIPRPETEHLVVEALDRAKQIRETRGDANAELRIADVGTGSGIIAISMAKHLKHCHLTAIDISPAALEIARRNAAKYDLDDTRITLVEGNLLEACPQEHPFDLILSNPPYVSQAEFEQLDKTVRDYEPQTALVAGPLGSETIVQLIEQAPAHLADDGWLIFELSPMLAEQIDTWIPAGWQAPIVTKDFAGHARIISLSRK